MSAKETLDRILGQLTPEKLRDIILSLSDRQSADTRSNVSTPDIMDAILGGADLGYGEEGWTAQLRLKQAIKDLVGAIAGMRYVEGDS